LLDSHVFINQSGNQDTVNYGISDCPLHLSKVMVNLLSLGHPRCNVLRELEAARVYYVLGAQDVSSLSLRFEHLMETLLRGPTK
jgi:hypothetical protein